MYSSKIAKLLSSILFIVLAFGIAPKVYADKPLDEFQAHPPIHVRRSASTSPTGLSPVQIRKAYNLPPTGGTGTIAIIDAFDNPTVESDLNTFSQQYGLPQCTTSNGCFEKYKMAVKIRANSGWALESALDTQWAHAIAPGAKILLVEAKSASGTDLINAVNYARGRSDVVSISMSWGGGEFSSEGSYDNSFTSTYGASFFASSGDSGNGAEWPAVSPNVVGVGGTTVTIDANGNLLSETAWNGSGGGLSVYEPQPGYQSAFGVPNANGKRAVPDVSYNADPNSGFSVYDSTSYNGQKGWFQVGGTSAGAPQWAAIKSLGGTVSNARLYQDATSSYSTYFRDIVSGTNGTCGFYCTSISSYDYVTGLGSPIKYIF